MANTRKMRVKMTLTEGTKFDGNGTAKRENKCIINSEIATTRVTEKDVHWEVGKRASLLISPSIQSKTYCIYWGPEQVMGERDLLSAQRYSNPGGNPLPGPSSTYPASTIMSQTNRISLKKSTATRNGKNDNSVWSRVHPDKSYRSRPAIRWSLLRAAV